jgi:acetyl esterase/lipase
VTYATRLWEAGVQAELHVWAGGFHGFEIVPHATVSRAAAAAREQWLDRILVPASSRSGWETLDLPSL